MSRPVARVNFGEVRDPTNVDLLDPKVDFLNLTLLNPLTDKTPFLAHFVAKSGPFGRFRVDPPGYGPVYVKVS